MRKSHENLDVPVSVPRRARGWCVSALALALAATLACAPDDHTAGEPVARTSAELVTLSTTPSPPIQGFQWKTKHVKPPGNGSGTAIYDNGKFTLSSNSSWGVKSLNYPDPPHTDNVQFAYFDLTQQNFEMVVRVESASPAGSVQAGLMLRENENADAVMGTVAYELGASHCRSPTAPTLNSFLHVTRTHHGAASVDATGDPSPVPEVFPTLTPASTSLIPPAVYLRLQKIGADYSVARSADGTRWSTLTGGDFEPSTSTPMLGIYVASEPTDWDGRDAQAQFTVLYAGAPRLEFKTESIGSSFVATSTNWISRGMQGFYVAPSGTSYKYAFDVSDDLPPGSEYNLINKFSATGVLEEIPYLNDIGAQGVLQGGITGDGTNVYFGRANCTNPAEAFCIEKRRGKDLKVLGRFVPSGTHGPLGRIGGMAARPGKVYVSDYDANKVRVFTTTPDTNFKCPELPALTFALPNPPSALTSAAPGPGPIAVDGAERIWVARNQAGYAKCAGLGSPCNNPLMATDPEAGAEASHAAMRNFFADSSACPHGCDPNLVGIWRCTTTASSSCSLQIPVENPTALAVSPAGTTLLVADNGQNQNILACSNLGPPPPAVQPTPSCLPFGQSVFAQPAPGAVDGTTPRFFSPIGVGVDSFGKLYVASGAPRAQIQKFDWTAPGTPLLWSRYGLGPDPGAFDPSTDGNDYYTPTRHFAFSVPKNAFVPKGVSLNPFPDSIQPPPQPPPPLPTLREEDSHRLFPTLPQAAPFVRRIKPAGATGPATLFLFLQGNETNVGGNDTSTLYAYRFEGEVAHPWAWLRFVYSNDSDPGTADWLPELWVDNGAGGGTALNGKAEDGERQKLPQASHQYAPGQKFGVDVDADGNLWIAFAQQVKLDSASINTGNVWKLPAAPTTVSVNGTNTWVPVYSWGTRLIYDIPDTWQFGVGNFITTPLIPRYDNSTQSLYLLGKLPFQQIPGYETASASCSNNVVNAVVRLDLAGQGSPDSSGIVSSGYVRHPGYPVPLPSPNVMPDPPPGAADPTTLPSDSGYPADCRCDPDGDYYSFDIAGEMFFAQERNWYVHAHWKEGGGEAARLVAGPEVSGHQDVADITFGVMRAFRRSNGEYLVTLSDTTQQARTLLFRWTPQWTPQAFSPVAWYSADAQYVQTAPTDTSIVEWRDRSGNDRTLVQTLSGNRPIFNSVGWSPTKPAISFNGTTAYLYRTWNAGPPLGAEQPFTVLAVLKATSVTSGGIASFYGPTGGGWVASRLLASSGHLFATSYRQGQEGPFDAQLYTGTIDLGTSSPHVIAYSYDGAGRHKITVDGQLQTSAVLPAVQTVGASDMQLFVGREDNLYWHNFAGKLAELVVVGRELTTSELASYRTYAKATWAGGLP